MEGLDAFSAIPQTCRERSGQESAEAIVVEDTSRGRDARVNNDTGELTPLCCVHAATLHRILKAAIAATAFTQRRAELHGNALTAWRTVNPPLTPDGEVEPRVVTMGSMWAFRSGLRPVSYAGSSRVRAEPPCTDPYARWCGTGGWLSESVTGTRFGRKFYHFGA
jgi:hypothetical protein